MSANRHSKIWKEYFSLDSEWAKFDYYFHSAFDISSYNATKGMLKEHFRSADDIASFYNEIFYHGELRVRSREKQMNFPAILECKDSFQWIDVSDGRKAEIAVAVDCFKRIYESGYTGTVGIISPLRVIVDEIANNIYGKGYPEKAAMVNTSYGFQGGECDVIIFVAGYNDDLTKTQRFYLCDSSNKNIYNVSVSRAIACFIIVGDRAKCKASDSFVLKALSEYPKPLKDGADRFDSPLEKKLYDALLAKGIKTTPQFYCLGYRLDLAYEDENIKLDIEVDGSKHFELDHSRKIRDYRRDFAVQHCGWKPIRFVSVDVIERVDECVEKIESEINRGRNLRAMQKSI